MAKPLCQIQAGETLVANATAVRALLDELQPLAAPLQDAALLVGEALLGGRKLLTCGTGGSACDAAHFAEELSARYQLDRPGYPALDLTAEHAAVMALVNDFPPEQVFARRVQAMGGAGDVLAVFSTSGRSTNVCLALEAAPAKQMKTIAMLGGDGGDCRGLADVELIVPSASTARVQEAHLLLYHTICEVLDPVLAGEEVDG